MSVVTLAWGAGPSANVDSYLITWADNGTALPSVSVPRTPAGDASGYASIYPGPDTPGDSITASVVAVDTPNGLQSTPVEAGPVVIPTPPPVAPLPPVNVTLTVS